MNNEMDLNLERLQLDLKLTNEELLIVRGAITEIDGLSVGEIEKKQAALRDALIPSDPDYKAKTASLVLMQNVVMQLKGQNPIESHDSAFLNLTKEDAREDAQQLREQGFEGVAEQMEASIDELSVSDVPEREKRDKILAKANERLANMKAQQIKDERAAQEKVEFQNRAFAAAQNQ